MSLDLANFCPSYVAVVLSKLWTADSRTTVHSHCAHLHTALTTSYARTYLEVIRSERRDTAATKSDKTEVHRCLHNRTCNQQQALLREKYNNIRAHMMCQCARDKWSMHVSVLPMRAVNMHKTHRFSLSDQISY